MKKIIQILICGLIIIFSCDGLVEAKAASAQNPVTSQETQTAIKQILADHQVNGVVVVNGKNNQPLVISNQIRGVDATHTITGERLFPIASLNKLITGIAIQQQLNRGKLSLNDKLSQYYPQVTNSNQITIKDLITHTSDLQDTSQASDQVMKKQSTRLDYTLTHYLATGRFTWAYSNTDYVLLAGILSKLTHQSYHSYVQSHFIKPLKLKQTKYFDQVKASQVAVPLSEPNPKTNLLTLQKNMSVTLGAGDYFFSAKEYWRFVNAVAHDRFVKISSINQNIDYSTGTDHYFDGVYFRTGKIFVANGCYGDLSSSMYCNYGSHQTMVIFTNNIPYNQEKLIASQISQVYFNQS